MKNPVRIFWSSYTRLLAQRPLLAQTLSTSVLMGAGDVISQKFIERRKGFDLDRNKNFWIVGACFLGPALSKWMFFLDRFFVGPAKVKMLKMVLADQALFAPPALFIIISFLSVLKGQSVEQWKNQMSENYPTILATNYKLWPVAQLINFNFTPLRFRYVHSVNACKLSGLFLVCFT
ncbi:unnamed protein product [Calicophoron daubneyi]|uniref:Mitochondrial inner membrane protein Mpv17 n=1 Tax=Calicophoron daubneyi TaxID=300641 RepID=A0AAV2T395_CALDB